MASRDDTIDADEPQERPAWVIEEAMVTPDCNQHADAVRTIELLLASPQAIGDVREYLAIAGPASTLRRTVEP